MVELRQLKEVVDMRAGRNKSIMLEGEEIEARAIVQSQMGSRMQTSFVNHGDGVNLRHA